MNNRLRLPGFFKNPIVLVALAVIVLAAAALVYGARYHAQNDDATPVEKGLGSAVTWLQTGVSKLSDAVVSLFKGPYWDKETVEDYLALKEEVAELRRESDSYDEIAAENARLTALLGLEETYADLDPIAARVINRAQSAYSSVLVIDKGTNDGVQQDMAVIADGGLVGRVSMAAASWARVTCIIDSASSVPAYVDSTRDPGVVRGNAAAADADKLLYMLYLPDDAEVSPGDRVVTSGMGGVFAKGLVIGTVSAVERGGTDYDAVVVEPSVDFAHLEEVLVVGGASESVSLDEEADAP